MYRYQPTILETSAPHNRLRGLLGAPADDIRRDLVERVRREIAGGTYETPEKWQAALDGLARDLE